MNTVDNTAIESAMERFHAINDSDPNSITIDGKSYPAAVFYAERLDHWIKRLVTTPSVALLIAARCQHLRRFEHPRSSYPEGREGYLKWRKDQGKLSAAYSAEILTECAVDPAIIEEVRRINLKSDMRNHADVQTMEDALCLLTLEYQMDNIIATSSEEQLYSIIEKVWKKMSEKARTLAHDINHRMEVKQALSRLLTAR